MSIFVEISKSLWIGRWESNPRLKLGKLAAKSRRLNWRHLVNLERPQMENKHRLRSPDAARGSSNQPGWAATTVKNCRGRTIRMSWNRDGKCAAAATMSPEMPSVQSRLWHREACAMFWLKRNRFVGSYL